MPLPLLGIGAGLGIASSIGKFISGGKQVKESKKINPVFNQYQANPFAKQQLGIAQQLFGGRMAGAPELERNLFSSQANFMGNVGRNATDSSQALALGAASQGQTNEALSELQTKEAQNKFAMLQNLNQAYGTNIREGDKEYDSMRYKFEQDAARKDALRGAGEQNKFGAVSDLASMAFIGGQVGLFGSNVGRGNAAVSGMQTPNTNRSGVGGRLNWMGTFAKRWNPGTQKFE